MRVLSKFHSSILVEKFQKWYKELISEIESRPTVIIVEGHRDTMILNWLNCNKANCEIWEWAQYNWDHFHQSSNLLKLNPTIILLVDFDRQGEEYVIELTRVLKNFNLNLRIRKQLFALTNGKLAEFEDFQLLLKKLLHYSSWLIVDNILSNQNYLLEN